MARDRSHDMTWTQRIIHALVGFFVYAWTTLRLAWLRSNRALARARGRGTAHARYAFVIGDGLAEGFGDDAITFGSDAGIGGRLEAELNGERRLRLPWRVVTRAQYCATSGDWLPGAATRPPRWGKPLRGGRGGRGGGGGERAERRGDGGSLWDDLLADPMFGRADLCVVAVGGMDQSRDKAPSPARTAANVRALRDALLARGKAVAVVLLPPPPSGQHVSEDAERNRLLDRDVEAKRREQAAAAARTEAARRARFEAGGGRGAAGGGATANGGGDDDDEGKLLAAVSLSGSTLRRSRVPGPGGREVYASTEAGGGGGGGAHRSWGAMLLSGWSKTSQEWRRQQHGGARGRGPGARAPLANVYGGGRDAGPLELNGAGFRLVAHAVFERVVDECVAAEFRMLSGKIFGGRR